MNKKKQYPITDQIRIVLAIAGKDIIDAIKNRTMISIILTTLFIIVVYRFLPDITSGVEEPRIRVYDAGESALVEELENSVDMIIRVHSTEESMLEYLTNAGALELGLIIPEGFDNSLSSGSPIPVEGYVLHWVSQEEAQELKTYMEGHLQDILGTPVEVVLQDPVYTRPDSLGFTGMAGIAMMLSAVMITIMIPHLVLEERKSRTLDALMVSPASNWHIIAGKGLAGLFYCLIAAAISMATFSFMIVNWPLMIYALLLASLMSTAFGLLLGVLIESLQMLTLWSWAYFIPMLMPMFFAQMSPLFPNWLNIIFRLVPSVGLVGLVRAACSQTTPATAILWVSLEIFLVIGAILAVVNWKLKRIERI